MKLDQELKESLQLSFKYLRAYDEEQVISAMEGWLEVYGENTDQGLEDAALEADIDGQQAHRESPSVTQEDSKERSDQQSAMVEPDTAVKKKSTGLTRKIILGVCFSWGVLILATLILIFS